LIELNSVSKSFDRVVDNSSLWRKAISRPVTEKVTAVEELDLSIKQGEFFSLLGPNGAGKTTTVRMICTLLLPDTGFCSVAGFDTDKDARAVRRNIGVSIRGERSVYWKLTGRQNLEYFAILYGIRGSSGRDRAIEVSRLVGLEEQFDDYVEHYSMGMKQRLAIGASLIHRPSVLVLDEPTIGLDPNGARSLRKLLRESCKEHGVTVLYTTHYMLEAEELSDRLAIIDKGKKVIEGEPAQIRSESRSSNVIEIQIAGSVDGEKLSHRLRDSRIVKTVLAVNEERAGTRIRLESESDVSSVTDISSLPQFQGLELQSIELVRPSLEDVFVQLTGSRLTEGGIVQRV